MTIFTESQGEVFIQNKGPGPANTLESLGQCTDLDDISEPLETSEPIICRDKDGNAVQVGEMKSPPGKVTTGVTILSNAVRSALEKIKCSYSLYVIQKACGRKGTYSDYELATILHGARNESRTFGAMVKREGDSPSTVAHSVSAWFPTYRVAGPTKITVERIATAIAGALNDIAMNTQLECDTGCTAIDPGDQGIIGVDSVGAATSDVLYSANKGATWAATTDPFGAGFHIVSTAYVLRPGGGIRWIVGREGLAAAVQGQIAFSDDNGVTWTAVNVGGAAAGLGPTRGGGIFALDYEHIWLCSISGYIFFSNNGGATWAAQEAGVITAGAYTQIHFIDSKVGVAVAAAGVTAFTRDGGIHWAAGGVVVAAVLNCVTMIDENIVWVGTAGGALYRSANLCVTWTLYNNFTGAAAGAVTDIQYLNKHIGWMTHNTAAPVGYFHRTINGGLTWERMTNSVVNAGLNALHAVDANNAFAVGELTGGTATIYRAYEG